MAVAFDVDRLELSGDPVPVVDGIALFGFSGGYSVSNGGTLVYLFGERDGVLDRSRDRLGIASLSNGRMELAPLPAREWRGARYSPDGRCIAYAGRVAGEIQIFVQDVEATAAPRQLTFQGSNSSPVWSPDGEYLAFASRRPGTEGGQDLFQATVGSDEPETRVTGRAGVQIPVDWPTQDVLLFEDRAAGGVVELWMVNPMDGVSPVPYLQWDASVTQGRVSPDRLRVVYVLSEAGRPAVFVSGFPEARQPSRVSPSAGYLPRWSPDGDVVYYWTGGPVYDSLMVAHVSTDPSFRVLSTELVLAEDRIAWDMHPRGGRALIVSPVPVDSEAPRVLVVSN